MAGMLLLAATTLCTSCDTLDGGEDDAFDSYAPATDSALPDGTGGEGGNTQAGIVTAGEWNDLAHWPFWSGLMTDSLYGAKNDYWAFHTNNRVAVEVVDAAGTPVAGVSVALQRGGQTLWQTVTDNHGLADCWVGLYQQETQVDSTALQLSIDGRLAEGHPSVCHWDSVAEVRVNRFVVPSTSAAQQRADIAFIVDATGSMGDEITFLKSDLVDIISRAETVRPSVTMRTAALFYRDEGDDYLTRHTDFTEKLDETARFVSQQRADGGGDYPEAVHTALEQMLQNLAWDSQARTRLAFLVLDAPAHHEADVISSLQQSVELCARMGIKLIPVAASGVDKNTEFMLRYFAIATGGTYVFLTNDSGVGGDHIKASVGDYEVEQLNNLLVRLIDYYTE